MTDELILEGVHPDNKFTTDRDARRIAIKATDEYLRNAQDFLYKGGDLNLLMYKAWLYEQKVYASAKRLKLTCDPLDEEIRINELEAEMRRNKKKFEKFNPLKLTSEPHCHKYPWKGPFIAIKGRGEENGRQPEVRRLHERRSISQAPGSKQKLSVYVKNKERASISQSRK